MTFGPFVAPLSLCRPLFARVRFRLARRPVKPMRGLPRLLAESVLACARGWAFGAICARWLEAMPPGRLRVSAVFTSDRLWC